MFKISGWVYLVGGICIALTIFAYAYFQYYKPDVLETSYIKEYTDQLQVEANKNNAAQERIDKAVARVDAMADQLRKVLEAKSQNGNGFIDLSQDPLQLTVNAPAFRDKVQMAVNKQVKSGGVTVIQGPLVPFPSNDPTNLMNTYFNYSRLPFPVVIFDLGNVTVTGTFDEIAKNVESWANMPDYFAVADGLAISGTSPQLTATYSVSIVGFIPGTPGQPLAGVVTGAAGSTAMPGVSGGGGGGGGG
ncbi:MAG TPA: hypothetical protein VNI20_03290, partial [Fimbriimonadaceae bacterium]|nr:hypothetical protein [Fimbriimonadaceae bacterium]